jgi:hypothetical protein
MAMPDRTTNNDAARIFHKALSCAKTLESLARFDSSKRGWIHAKTGCRLAAKLIDYAEKLAAPEVAPYPIPRLPPGEESLTPLVKWRVT